MLPKKIKQFLLHNNIKNVVDGYFSREYDGEANFTGWDKLGKVICVLICRDNNWQFKK